MTNKNFNRHDSERCWNDGDFEMGKCDMMKFELKCGWEFWKIEKKKKSLSQVDGLSPVERPTGIVFLIVVCDRVNQTQPFFWGQPN